MPKVSAPGGRLRYRQMVYVKLLEYKQVRICRNDYRILQFFDSRLHISLNFTSCVYPRFLIISQSPNWLKLETLLTFAIPPKIYQIFCIMTKLVLVRVHRHSSGIANM